jgi:hypothetical protein
MSEKGSTLGRGPALSCEREQRSEGRLILASIRNFNALPTEESASTRAGPKRSRPGDGRALYGCMWLRPNRYRVIAPKRGYALSSWLGIMRSHGYR